MPRGLLPEPPRWFNGYRVYGIRDTPPVPVTVRGDGAEITRLCFHADDVTGLVAAIRARASGVQV